VLGIEVNRFEPRRERVGRVSELLVPLTVEGEIAVDEANELSALRESELVLMVTNPAMELGSDEVEVLRRGAAAPLADGLRVLTAEP
jgi:hypothetical protein